MARVMNAIVFGKDADKFEGRARSPRPKTRMGRVKRAVKQTAKGVAVGLAVGVTTLTAPFWAPVVAGVQAGVRTYRYAR